MSIPTNTPMAVLVQKAAMKKGYRGQTVPMCPAILSIGGLLWTSPIPETQEQADFFNGAAERIESQNTETSREAGK